MMMSKLETNFLTSEERLSLIRDHKLEKDGRKRDRMKFILYSVQNKIRIFVSDNIEIFCH